MKWRNIGTRYNSNKDAANNLPVGVFAWIWLGVCALFSVGSFNFFRRVFSGELFADQNLFRFKVESINLFGLELPFQDIVIRIYAIMFLIALTVGFVFAIYLVNRTYLPNTLIDRLFVGLVIFGLIGARLLFVVFNLDYFISNPLDIPLIYKGGMTIFGGIIGAAIYLWIYTRRYQFSVFEIADVLVPSLVLGQIVGRFGNFFNYEAYGSPTSLAWKMYVPEAARNANGYAYRQEFADYFHPTFLYESIGLSILLFFILFYFKKLTTARAGLVAGIYLVAYGVIRYIIEFFRLDTYRFLVDWSVPVPQFIVDGVNFVTIKSLPEWVIDYISSIDITYIRAGQVLSLLFIIIGIYVLKTRSKIIYSPKNLVDLNG